MSMEFGKLNFAVGFNRTSAFPLEANSYFESYDDAVTAAAGAVEVGSADSAYYIGQVLIVKDAKVGVGLYQINAGKTLTKFGQASSADELAGKVSALETRCTTIEGKLILATSEADGLMSSADKAKLDALETTYVQKDGDKVLSDNNYSAADKAIVDGIEGKLETEKQRAMAAEKENKDAIAADVKNLADNYYNKTQVEEKIAGKKTAYVYQDKADETYLADLKTQGKFNLGDNIYFKAKKVSDQWVSAILAEADASGYFYELSDLEVDHPSLEGYATKDEVSAVSTALDKETTRATGVENEIKNSLLEKATTEALNAVSADVAAIKADYLKSSDKTELTTAIGKKAEQTALDTANTAIEGLQTSVGSATDEAADDGSLYARIAKEVATRTSEDASLLQKITANETAITGLRGDLGLKEDTSDKETVFGKIAKLTEDIAAAGKIDSVKVNGVALPIEDKAVDITIPDALVKSVEATQLSVSEQGKLGIKAVNVNLLEQTEGDTLVLQCGTATK